MQPVFQNSETSRNIHWYCQVKNILVNRQIMLIECWCKGPKTLIMVQCIRALGKPYWNNPSKDLQC